MGGGMGATTVDELGPGGQVAEASCRRVVCCSTIIQKEDCMALINNELMIIEGSLVGFWARRMDRNVSKGFSME